MVFQGNGHVKCKAFLTPVDRPWLMRSVGAFQQAGCTASRTGSPNASINVAQLVVLERVRLKIVYVGMVLDSILDKVKVEVVALV